MTIDLPAQGARAFRASRGEGRVHNGIDLRANEGQPIYAAQGGTVEVADTFWHKGFSGYGRVVVLRSDGADQARQLFAHLTDVVVMLGKHIQTGDLIGHAGRTAFGRDNHESLLGHAHLHFEVAPGPYPMARTATRLDPIAWLTEPGAGRVHPVSRQPLGATREPGAAAHPFDPGPVPDSESSESSQPSESGSGSLLLDDDIERIMRIRLAAIVGLLSPEARRVLARILAEYEEPS